jgi:hypothetical protein
MKSQSHYFGLIVAGCALIFGQILSCIGNGGIYLSIVPNLPGIVGAILAIHGAINFSKSK